MVDKLQLTFASLRATSAVTQHSGHTQHFMSEQNRAMKYTVVASLWILCGGFPRLRVKSEFIFEYHKYFY